MSRLVDFFRFLLHVYCLNCERAEDELLPVHLHYGTIASVFVIYDVYFIDQLSVQIRNNPPADSTVQRTSGLRGPNTVP